ncbi:Synembryn-like protein [Lachnellula suecica]|uniref:Synembryn-like protein n=1 Tax=Lachnellula suecica TaxID=602035 RepID=A0A8T9BVD7_9HELO|nr:Synembryn-like protein [Lachnellula suecica]
MSFSSPRTSSSSAELTGAAKLEDVTRLMDKLSADLQEVNLLPHQRDAHLEQLKGIETVTRHALNSPSQTTSRNALRCLANAMLLCAETRQIFLDLGYEAKLCNKLKNDSRDDEFLVSRIIFLTTYAANLDIEKLIDQYHLADTVCVNIGRHTKQYTTRQKTVKELDPMEDMALIESLKLLFNLSHFCPERSAAFSPALPHVLLLLCRRPISSTKPLEPSTASLVNALINLDLGTKENSAALLPKSTPNLHINRLIEILDKSVQVYTDDDLEHLVSPLLTLLHKIYELAPEGTKIYLQNALLPSVTDRQQPLGKAESLSSRLLRLSTNPTTPQVRESVSSLLFSLSGKDARKFVQNVGYGFASGFLFQHNMSIPENALEAFSTSDRESRASQDSRNQLDGIVNPVTGQLLDKEKQVDAEPMTQEEKEREAERLFVLFERLKKTGIVDIQNPVETAYQQGRFLELDDDADSE